MRRWKIDPARRDWPDTPELEAALADLLAGRLLAVPTETVYGLAGDATDPEACAAIFAAKGRPQFNPLIAHVDSFETAKRHGVFNEDASALATAFWPGPLTLVVPKSPESTVCDLATAGLDTVALRVPSAAIMRDLASGAGVPVAAPSANRSGRISGTTADDVAADLGPSLALLIDAGPTPVGVESTIVGLVDGTPRLLRPGGIPREDLETVLGHPLAGAATPQAAGGHDAAPLAPGMLTSHYAPDARMRLNATALAPGEALLAFGPAPLPGQEHAVAVEQLSSTGDPREAAARLFSALRRLDASGAATIAVMPIPREGLGEAINDRLGRAAAPR
ncbi:MAG: threonylcarbamoyl-AMP synthase [Stappia sp.]|nr:threonylcarbamoyl-AMP synthase [Stappia sp.]